MKQVLMSMGVLLLVSTLTVAQDYTTYDEGVAKFKAGEYDAVIDLFSGILNNPEHSKRLDEDLYFYRGQAYYHKDQYANALTDLDQSLTLNHYNKGIIHWYKARCYDKQGKTAEATQEYQDALTAAEKNRKTSALILNDRAKFYERRGDKQAAQQDLAAAKLLDAGGSPATSPGTNPSQPASSRTAGDDKKSSPQVIVRTNGTKPDARKKEDAKKSDVKSANTAVPSSSESTAAAGPVRSGLIPPLAEAYKDEKRYALVIGNGNYGKEIGSLKNPVNDATDIATELRRSDFEVQLLTNATYIQIREAMRKFHEKLTNGPKDQTVGLFYYAGHGVQFQDENYLVPVDADVKYEDDIVRMCFPVQRMVLANMERSNSRMNIVILDACRNNPFPATTRSVTSGLAEMKRARGSFIAYATAPGSVASDGSGRNGLYTQELLKSLRRSGLTIEQVFKEVRMNVLRLSGDRQYTWDSSNIIGEFYFKF